MKIVLTSLFVIFTLGTINSQPREYILPALNMVKDTPWRDKIYLFTTFHKGIWIFDTGHETPHKNLLNHNIFRERMEEILPTGDTVALKTSPLQPGVRIGGYEFRYFPGKGYMRVLQSGSVSLAVWEYFMSTFLVVASNGYVADTLRGNGHMDDRAQPFSTDRSYQLRSEFYLLTNNDYYPARKPGFLKVYENDKGVVEYYLNKPELFYTNADSLARVIRLFNELSGAPESKVVGVFRVKAGESVSKQWRDSLYVFPQFREGDLASVINRKLNGTLRMNYNLLTREMDYIADIGDTLRLKSRDVTSIQFDHRVFYRQPNGDFGEVLVAGKHSLCETKRLKLIQEYKNPDVLTTDVKLPRTGEDISSDRLYVVERTYYFLADRSEISWPANKGGFVRAFPKTRKKIDSYLAEHPVNFEKKNDLMRLLAFCQQF